MKVVKMNVRDFSELNQLDSTDLNEISVEVRSYNKTVDVKRLNDATLNGPDWDCKYGSLLEWLLEEYGDCDVIQADWLMTDKYLMLLLVRENKED